jgi:hypothetical protein
MAHKIETILLVNLIFKNPVLILLFPTRERLIIRHLNYTITVVMHHVRETIVTISINSLKHVQLIIQLLNKLSSKSLQLHHLKLVQHEIDRHLQQSLLF